MTDALITDPVDPVEATAVPRSGLRHVLMHPAVLVVGLMGIALRMWIVLSPTGTLNGDEAYTGLQAAAITHGHMPIMMGDAAYTGLLDVYLLAPFVWIFGQHILLLKLMSPLFWALASVLTVGAARRILSDRAALLAGSMVWLAPGALIVLSTRSYVAYAFGFGLVVSLIWSAFVLVERDLPTIQTSALTGALAGLAFYTHPMFAAVAAPISIVVALRHWRHVREFWVPAVGAAVVVNLPFLLWNARNSWPSLHQPRNDFEGTYTSRLRGFFTGLLPRDLGVRHITGGEWLLGRPIAALVTLAAVSGAAYGAYRLVRANPWRGAVLATPLVFAWPLMAALRPLSYVDDGRYGIVVFAVLVMCLAAAAEPLLDRLPPPSWGLVATAWMLLLAVPFLRQEAGTDLGNPNTQTQALIDVLESEGFERVAGHYFAVLPIEYQSGGRIRVAVAGNPYFPRLPDTQRLVDATPAGQLAYVFAPGPVGETWVKLPLDRYRTVDVAGWTLYFPT